MLFVHRLYSLHKYHYIFKHVLAYSFKAYAACDLSDRNASRCPVDRGNAPNCPC